MVSTERYSQAISYLRHCCQSVEAGDAVASDIENWMKIAQAAIDSLNSLLQWNSGDMRKYQNFHAHFQSIWRVLEGSLKRGAGLQQQQQQRVTWDDVRTAFQSRIKSGIITNVRHIDVKSFMEDAAILFKEQIELVLSEHKSVKVNTELAAEYVILKSDGEESEAIKYFNTKSNSIF